MAVAAGLSCRPDGRRHGSRMPRRRPLSEGRHVGRGQIAGDDQHRRDDVEQVLVAHLPDRRPTGNQPESPAAGRATDLVRTRVVHASGVGVPAVGVDDDHDGMDRRHLPDLGLSQPRMPAPCRRPLHARQRSSSRWRPTERRGGRWGKASAASRAFVPQPVAQLV
jgi:hypothetical protein